MMTQVVRRVKLPAALLIAAAQLILLPRPFRAADDDSRLERARKVNLAYAANMPSFVADETARRYTSKSNSAKWQPLDTIQSEVTFVGTPAGRDTGACTTRPVAAAAAAALATCRAVGGADCVMAP